MCTLCYDKISCEICLSILYALVLMLLHHCVHCILCLFVVFWLLCTAVYRYLTELITVLSDTCIQQYIASDAALS
jgi:uncharacterized oligopeptide transporter (OPT) family protein